MSQLSLETSMRMSQTLSPQMIQSLKLLQYSNLQLEQVIRKEIQENPILEESQEEPGPEEAPSPDAPTAASRESDEDAPPPIPAAPAAPTVDTDDEEARAVPAQASPVEEVNWKDYEYETFEPPVRRGSDDDDGASDELYEKINMSSVSLEEHLTRQLHEKKLSDARMEIGEFIIGNIDDRGYLTLSPQEIAEKFHVPVSEVNEVRYVIQRFDPPGVASLDLRECLLVQVHVKGLSGTLMARIIEHHFDLLKKYQMQEIGKKMGLPVTEIQTAVREIGRLEPNPGTLVGATRAQVIMPELTVVKEDNGDFTVSLNDGNVPSVRVSRSYVDILRKEQKKSPEVKKYVSEKLNAANWLIRAIEQRRVTMLKVMNAIVGKQREWFEKGPPNLRPLRLQEVADEIGLHISTVCRVTNEKYVQTPYGIFELKSFFSSGVEQEDGSEVSTSRAKNLLQELVAAEPKNRPHSDQKLVKLLKEKGIEVARRTVSKYREQIGILPARMRKEF